MSSPSRPLFLRSSSPISLSHGDEHPRCVGMFMHLIPCASVCLRWEFHCDVSSVFEDSDSFHVWKIRVEGEGINVCLSWHSALLVVFSCLPTSNSLSMREPF